MTNNDKWDTDKILNLRDDAEKGYLFDVNLHYPEEFHDLHNGYALGPEKKQLKNICLISGNKKIIKSHQLKNLLHHLKIKKIIESIIVAKIRLDKLE